MPSLRVSEILRRPAVACFCIANVVFLTLVVAVQCGLFVAAELLAFDVMRRARAPEAADSRIAIIEVTETDIRRLGYPMQDALLAEALEKLTDYGARAVAVDIYRDTPVGSGAERLAAVLRRNPGIVWTMNFGGRDQESVAPPAMLAGSEQVGFNDMVVDPGGTVRRGLLFLDDGKTSAMSMPLRVVLNYLKPVGLAPDARNPDHVRLGQTTIVPFEPDDGGYVGADAAGYQFLLDYGDMPGKYRSYTLSQLLGGAADPAAIRGRIVFVGNTAKSVNDFFYTPYSAGREAEQRMYGVELHARIASQLLRMAQGKAEQVRPLDGKAEFGWLWIWCVLAGLISLFAYSLWKFVAAAFAGTVTIAGIAHGAMAQSVWIPLVEPLTGFLVSAGIASRYLSNHEKRERMSLMNIFSKHVSPEIAEVLWRDREQFLEGRRPRPQKITATVLATDIQGFTTVSEKLDPEQLLAWLNEYMEAMVQVVAAHHGVVDKFIGDAVMAVFGVPVARTNQADLARDAINAVSCALDMERQLDRLNLSFASAGLPKIAMRAGIYTGPLVAGSLGGGERMQFTVLGDTVNIAFRLESFKGPAVAESAQRSCRILIGDTTWRLLGDCFETQAVGDIDLKGKDRKVSAYHVLRERADGAKQSIARKEESWQRT